MNLADYKESKYEGLMKYILLHLVVLLLLLGWCSVEGCENIDTCQKPLSIIMTNSSISIDELFSDTMMRGDWCNICESYFCTSLVYRIIGDSLDWPIPIPITQPLRMKIDTVRVDTLYWYFTRPIPMNMKGAMLIALQDYHLIKPYIEYTIDTTYYLIRNRLSYWRGSNVECLYTF